MEVLDKIVKEMLEQHTGGETFFDNLDKAVTETPIIERLIEMYNNEENFGRNIICSGKFGMFFSNFLSANYDSEDQSAVIVVNGGLRKNLPIDDLSYLFEKIKDKEFIFIDDSFYSGKTRDAVLKEIERLNGKLVRSYVIYDGSKEKDETVHSLYRYYDKH